MDFIAISYKLKFIVSACVKVSSLSNLVDNLVEGIHKIKFKDRDHLLEFKSIKSNLINYKCLSWNKGYLHKINKEFKKEFMNPFKFSNNDINKFILLLRKGVYPYKYMDEWKIFNETSLPQKYDFYSNLNMENTTDVGYMQRVCNDC